MGLNRVHYTLTLENYLNNMCNCGCNICETKISLNESKLPKPLAPQILSEGLNYHLDNNIPLYENIYQYGSENFFNLLNEARKLYSRGMLDLNEEDKDLIKTHIGSFGIYEGKRVPLDFPMLDEDLDEAKKKKDTKKKPIGKPMRDSSGGSAYKVYVKDPKTGNIKTVRFGSGGLKAKINNPKARAAFAKRHKCSQKKDRTKASYWSCRLPRYAKLLGLKSSFSGFW